MPSITIDKASFLIVCTRGDRMLGSGFVFLSSNYIVTAKHVVEEYGLPRNNLSVIFYNIEGEYPVQVVFMHPELDIAVLEMVDIICKKPLIQSALRLADSECFFTIGYKPSESSRNDGTMEVNQILRFEIEKRERESIIEESMVFDCTFLEGGHSGGPILADDGKVIAIVTDANDAETAPSGEGFFGTLLFGKPATIPAQDFR